MRCFFKIISFIGLIITSVIFGIVFFGEKTIPDEIHLVDSEEININDMFSCAVADNKNLESVRTGAAVSVAPTDDEYEYTLNVSILNTIPVKSSNVIVSKRKYVVPSGDVFGIKLYTDGVMIVGMDEVITQSGTENPGVNAGLEIGDVIKSLNDKSICKVTELTNFFQSTSDKIIKVTAVRNGKPFETTLTLVKSASDDKYKAGLWVRDSTAGVGTVTYYDYNSGVFGGLGHAVCDIDSGCIMPMLDGDAVETVISGCYKGSNGTTGELCGVFTNQNIGKLLVNGEHGIYGVLNKYKTGKEIPVATKQEITTGPVQIISTIDDTGPHYYKANIVKIFKTSEDSGKNMIIEITDEDLISKTGGIVQGMSGSPIIQNGMLVGAVTHVFVNNSQQGYAIFAENMLQVSQTVEDSVIKKAS